MKLKLFCYFILILVCVLSASAQKLTSPVIKDDSVYFSKPYPYILPILGDRVHEAKIKFPLPFGIMYNTLTGVQYLALDDMTVGFGGSTNYTGMIDVSDIVVFDETKAQTSTFNLRLDTWILPFLNVYGIVGQTKKADINVNLVKPFELGITTEVLGTYVGYGAMVNYAFGSVFISLDGNRTYSYNPRLDKPARLSLAGLRSGYIFRNKKKPEMNISVWLGTMYNHLNGGTEGSINISEIAPDAPAKVEEMQNSLDEWYNDLSGPMQKLFEDKYNKLNNGLVILKEDVENGYINYSFKKTINKPMNMVVGGQWQVNLRWQLRAEMQFLGDRTAGLFSLNYRFGIRGKNWFSHTPDIMDRP